MAKKKEGTFLAITFEPTRDPGTVAVRVRGKGITASTLIPATGHGTSTAITIGELVLRVLEEVRSRG